MDDETVQILIKAKNEAAPAMKEASLFALNFKDAINSLNRATAEGVPIAQAMRQALGELTRGLIESDLSARDQAAQIKDTRQALEKYIEVVSAGMAPESAYNAILEANTAEMVQNATATTAASSAAGGGIPVWAMWTAGIGAALVVLFPFVAVLTAAVVVMTASAVAATGMALALAGATGMFLAIGAAIVLLDNKMGWINNSMATLKSHLTGVAVELAKLSAPAGNQIIQFIDSLLPLAQSFGTDIISWFSVRLPLALTSMHTAINNLAPDLRGFGSFLGAMFDKLSPSIVPMFEEIARFGIGALQGLISNLVDLGQWFQTRLPSYLPVLNDMFGGLGSGVQSLATNFGKLSDWFVGQWPNIKKNLDAFTGGFSDAFDKLNKTFGGPGSVDWTGFFHTLGEAVGGAAAAIGDISRVVGIVFSQVVAALPAALQTIGDNWANFVHAFIQDINGLISAYDSLPPFLRGGQTIPLITNILPPGAASSGDAPASGRGGNGPPAGGSQKTVVVISPSPLLTAHISRGNRALLST